MYVNIWISIQKTWLLYSLFFFFRLLDDNKGCCKAATTVPLVSCTYARITSVSVSCRLQMIPFNINDIFSPSFSLFFFFSSYANTVTFAISLWLLFHSAHPASTHVSQLPVAHFHLSFPRNHRHYHMPSHHVSRKTYPPAPPHPHPPWINLSAAGSQRSSPSASYRRSEATS